MAEVQTEEVYLLDRNSKEADRLNSQHAFLVDLVGSLLHPSIPIEGIQAVADIATGTGIWLRDIASLLSSHNPNPTHPYYLHGFDISSAQFLPSPPPSNAEIHLSVQNCVQPFPAEHHGRYDVVHLQLLVGALRTTDYEAVLNNVFEILKPGGYFVWSEFDMTTFATEEDPQPLLITETNRIIGNAIAKFNLCATAPEHIEQGAQRTSFVDVRREHFNTRSKPELVDAARAWTAEAVRALIPSSLVKTGEIEEEAVARQYVEGLLVGFEEQCAGVLPMVNMEMVVGRRPVGAGQ